MMDANQSVNNTKSDLKPDSLAFKKKDISAKHHTFITKEGLPITQKQKVLALLLSGKKITSYYAVVELNIQRLSAVIHELRRDFPILTDMKKVFVEKYERPRRYAEYFIHPDDINEIREQLGC